MKYLGMNKKMSFLQDTVFLAAKDLSYYMLLLITVIFGFFTMTNVAFGKNSYRFSNMSMASIYVFEMIFGTYDYEEMREADPVLAPVFFCTYMFLSLFILVNVFIAILETAYGKVKEDMADDDSDD
jgi:polycystin 2